MDFEKIEELAIKANSVCENNDSYRRFWIEGDRFFICNNVEDMDDIDEVSEAEFISRINRLIYGL